MWRVVTLQSGVILLRVGNYYYSCRSQTAASRLLIRTMRFTAVIGSEGSEMHANTRLQQ